MRRLFAIALSASALSTLALAQQPAAKPAPAQAQPAGKLVENPPYALGPAIAQKYPAKTFFYVSTTATQKTMGDTMKTAIPQLLAAAAQAGIGGHSPIVLVYHGITPDPNAQFEVEAGLLVDTGTQPAAGAEVRQLEPFNCVSMVYTGQSTMVGKAYEALFPAMMAAGKMPNQEMRQMILYFEDEQSSNNMMLIQIGV